MEGVTSVKSREETFGKALACLNAISTKRFERGKPNVSARYLSDLIDRPMTIYYRAFKDVMQYGAQFDEEDERLLYMAHGFISHIDVEDYSDEALRPSTITYFSNQTKRIVESKGTE